VHLAQALYGRTAPQAAYLEGVQVRRLSLGSTFLLFVAATVVLPSATATAALTISVDAEGVLSVTGDDERDRINVRCNDSENVTVSGQEPASGSAACSAITRIEISGGSGSDTITLRQLDPAAFSAVTSVVVSGGDGGDNIRGSPLVDQISGGNDNDGIVADPFNGDVVDGGPGADGLDSLVPSEVVVTDTTFETPSETVTFAGVESLGLTGTPDADRIDARAFSGRTYIDGGRGDDYLRVGRRPRSQLYGAAGNDALTGGPGQDYLDAGRGDDVVRGRGGSEFLADGFGNDRYYLGAGNDTFVSLRGRRNVFSGGSGRDEVQIYPFSGTARLTDSSLTMPSGSARLSSIERAFLYHPIDFPQDPITFDARRFSGATFLDGTLRDDVILGGVGPDFIRGFSGSDRLTGSTGNDTLDGGDGTDSCDGGPGDDEILECE
jgi:Ca2+-binding RTX toxin-like protein